VQRLTTSLFIAALIVIVYRQNCHEAQNPQMAHSAWLVIVLWGDTCTLSFSTDIRPQSFRAHSVLCRTVDCGSELGVANGSGVSPRPSHSFGRPRGWPAYPTQKMKLTHPCPGLTKDDISEYEHRINTRELAMTHKCEVIASHHFACL
jgi:hypothetical protein